MTGSTTITHAARATMTLALAAVLTLLALGHGTAQEAGRWGEGRDDLARFHGLYGTPGDPNGRNYFVAEARAPRGADVKIPEGLIMIGAMWGDVAPWIMKSLEDTRFVRPGWNEYNPDIHVRFETGPDGKATAMIFEDFEHEDRKRLERIGDQPEDFQ